MPVGKMLNIHISERNHWITMVALSFLLGCLCAPQLLPGLWTWALFAIAALAALLLSKLRFRAWLAVALCCWSLGVLRTHASLNVAQPEPGLYEVTASVSGGPTVRGEDRIAFLLTDISLDGRPVSGRAYATLQTYDAPLPELFDGALVRMQGQVYLPSGKSGEPHFDFRTWTLQKGLSFGIAAYEEIAVENTPHTAPVTDPWYRLREGMGRALRRVMGDEARVAIALLLGDRGGMSEDENQAFSELGIAHVMSVSGLHVGILGSILCWLMDRLRMQRLSQLAVLSVFLAAYCALTGFSAAAIRAAVMLVTYLLARCCLRYPDHLTALLFSMIVVLLINPLYAYSAGFVLSYSAMLGITLFSPSVREALFTLLPAQGKRLKRIREAVVGMLTVSITAQLGVLLPTMAYFQQMPTYGILINMLIVPLVSYVLMPLYAAVLPLSFLPGVGDALGALASVLTRFLLWLVTLLGQLPYASLRVPAPSAMVCIGLGLALVLLARRLPGRLWKRAVCAAVVFAVTLGGAWLCRPAEVRYIQLDVGQADSALIMDGRQTILIDAGEDGSAALDYLMAECRDIDALLITHLHMDHIGGVTELLNSPVSIRQVYLPKNAVHQQADPMALEVLNALEERGIPIAELASGDELRYNKTSIRVLWPDRDHERTGHDANDFSMVTLIDLDGYRILSTADLPGIYEKYAAVAADVLKVAHHGSSHSTHADFLTFVSPRYALISAAGSRSLPHPETLKQLEDSGARVLRTDQTGDVTLSIVDGALILSPYKAR